MDSTKKKLDNEIVQSNLEKFLDDYGIIDSLDLWPL